MKLNVFPDNIKDLSHYAIIYGAILFTWLPLMNLLNSNIPLIALVQFAGFIILDKILHWWLKV